MIQAVARILGKITSSFPASKFGRLHYRNLEYCKTNAMKQNTNNFDTIICLSGEAKDDIGWLTNSIDRIHNNITVLTLTPK